MVVTLILFVSSSFGDCLYNRRDYFRAISEYKRDLFLGKDSLNAFLKIGRSYFSLGKPEAGLYWHSRAYYIDTKYKFEYEYMLALSGRFEEVKFLISENNMENNMEKKLKEFIDLAENERDYWKLSWLIPGSGQIISGHVRDGIFSSVCNIGSLYLIYDRAKKDDTIGSFFAFFYFLRFYIGNITSSRKFEKVRRTEEFRIRMEGLGKDYFYSD